MAGNLNYINSSPSLCHERGHVVAERMANIAIPGRPAGLEHRNISVPPHDAIGLVGNALDQTWVVHVFHAQRLRVFLLDFAGSR